MRHALGPLRCTVVAAAVIFVFLGFFEVLAIDVPHGVIFSAHLLHHQPPALLTQLEPYRSDRFGRLRVGGLKEEFGPDLTQISRTFDLRLSSS